MFLQVQLAGNRGVAHVRIASIVAIEDRGDGSGADVIYVAGSLGLRTSSDLTADDLMEQLHKDCEDQP